MSKITIPNKLSIIRDHMAALRWPSSVNSKKTTNRIRRSWKLVSAATFGVALSFSTQVQAEPYATLKTKAGYGCLDVSLLNKKIRNETNVITWGNCHSKQNQLWKVEAGAVSIQYKGNQYCLTATENKNGGNVVVKNCNPNDNKQKWTRDKDNRLINAGGRCLNAMPGTLSDGSHNVNVWDCDGGRSHYWEPDKALCAIVAIEYIEAVKVSASTDDVFPAFITLGDAFLQGAGEVLTESSGVLEKMPNPKAQAAGAVTKVAGAGVAALAGTLKATAGVVNAIADVTGDVDQLYLSTSDKAGQEVGFFPGNDKNREIKQGADTGELRGITRVVPYILGTKGANDSVTVHFWEYDSGSGDDYMGKIRFKMSGATNERRANMVIGSGNGGSVYGVEYRTIPVVCDALPKSPWSNDKRTGLQVFESILQSNDPEKRASWAKSYFKGNAGKILSFIE